MRRWERGKLGWMAFELVTNAFLLTKPWPVRHCVAPQCYVDAGHRSRGIVVALGAVSFRGATTNWVLKTRQTKKLWEDGTHGRPARPDLLF